MCVRTKTSYGCGHEYKTTNECGDSRCTSLERYHYPKSGDCRDCKRGGEVVTRGREGRGRYAKEIGRRPDRSEQREPLVEIGGNGEHRSLDVGAGISPWAASQGNKEKDWGSPTRLKADRAWLQEHAERNTDLQSIRETLSSSSSCSGASSTVVDSPSPRDRPVFEHQEDRHYHDYEHDHARRLQMDTTERNLQIEIRHLNDEHDRRSRRHPREYARHDSQESFESAHSTRSSSRRHVKPPTNPYAAFEYRDSGYGSYGSRASNGYESTSTEPYMYSPQPRTLKLKAPSAASYGVYHSGFGVGGVDIVTRTPSYSYVQRRY
ncbi:hypothetical protein B0A52_06101 [Exophiala mesophila]|uniref:Uncharacterized protein n=1 Tax=Exophiala mesophila TaxID=212818 RepID=A0A438N5J2_EXOME|nr:hypothetical protein B0A52_06101 [Exophiala mesophila]